MTTIDEQRAIVEALKTKQDQAQEALRVAQRDTYTLLIRDERHRELREQLGDARRAHEAAHDTLRAMEIALINCITCGVNICDTPYNTMHPLNEGLVCGECLRHAAQNWYTTHPQAIHHWWWIAWLEKRFGHADYLRLNKRWKRVHFASCANEIMLSQTMYQQCAQDKLAEIGGEVLTLEDAKRKLEIACAALSFIAGKVTILEPASEVKPS